jgi:hypothetical protein
MSFATRMILILMLTLPTLGKLVAQETTATTATTTTTTTDATATDTTGTATTTDTAETTETGDRDVASYEVRNQFSNLLLRHPDDLATVLAFDPSLLANQQFVAGYPELARFLGRHPEVAAAPRFYLAEFAHRTRRQGPLEDVMEPIMAFFAFLLATFAVGWFIRTLLEQRRWNKLSRTQAEVHNKILDRFGTTGELLEYVKSPAGTKFLESAPIPLHAPEPAAQQKQNAPLQRILWTVQAGVVLGAMGLGMLLVSLRYTERNGEGLFALGAIALCIGGGFIASAAVSIFLSRRLGLWQGAQPGPGPLTGDRYDVS